MNLTGPVRPGAYAPRPVHQQRCRPGVSHGFTDWRGVFTTLNDPHAGSKKGQGTAVQAISNRGIIVGVYFDSHGAAHGFELKNAR